MEIFDKLQRRDADYIERKNKADSINSKKREEIITDAINEVKENILKSIDEAQPEIKGEISTFSYNLKLDKMCKSVHKVADADYEEAKAIADFGKEIEKNLYTKSGQIVTKAFILTLDCKSRLIIKNIFTKTYYHSCKYSFEGKDLEFLENLFNLLLENNFKFSNITFNVSDVKKPISVKVNNKMGADKIKKVLSSFKRFCKSKSKEIAPVLKSAQINLTISYTL